MDAEAENDDFPIFAENAIEFFGKAAYIITIVYQMISGLINNGIDGMFVGLFVGIFAGFFVAIATAFVTMVACIGGFFAYHILIFIFRIFKH